MAGLAAPKLGIVLSPVLAPSGAGKASGLLVWCGAAAAVAVVAFAAVLSQRPSAREGIASVPTTTGAASGEPASPQGTKGTQVVDASALVISGRVLDADRTPVVGARLWVSAQPSTPRGSAFDLIAEATSSNGGPSSWRSPQNGSPRSESWPTSPSSSSRKGASESGEGPWLMETRSTRMRRSPGTSLQGNAWLEGVVVTEGGEPVPGAWVMAARSGENRNYHVPCVVAGPDGTFSLGPVEGDAVYELVGHQGDSTGRAVGLGSERSAAVWSQD